MAPNRIQTYALANKEVQHTAGGVQTQQPDSNQWNGTNYGIKMLVRVILHNLKIQTCTVMPLQMQTISKV